MIYEMERQLFVLRDVCRYPLNKSSPPVQFAINRHHLLM